MSTQEYRGGRVIVLNDTVDEASLHFQDFGDTFEALLILPYGNLGIELDAEHVTRLAEWIQRRKESS